MALRLTTEYKGIIANYWRINLFQYDDIIDTAIVHLWLYVDENATSDLQQNKLTRKVLSITGIKTMSLPEESEGFYIDVNGPRDLLKKMLYIKIKESNLDEEGNETNPFASAENC